MKVKSFDFFQHYKLKNISRLDFGYFISRRRQKMQQYSQTNVEKSSFFLSFFESVLNEKVKCKVLFVTFLALDTDN